MFVFYMGIDASKAWRGVVLDVWLCYDVDVDAGGLIKACLNCMCT